jgi:dihydrofolate reductase
MQHFISTTKGKTVVMGRKTFESIGKPLPNRENIVISKNKDFNFLGVKVYNSIDNVIHDYKNKDIYVIGGKGIYDEFMPYADVLLVSYINNKYDCDVFMQPINESKFKLSSSDDSDPLFSVKTFRRV